MAKQTIEVKLYMRELVYDVQQKVHLIGNSLRTDETSESAAKVQDLTDENKDVMLRSFGESYARLRNELSEYIVSTNRQTDNTLMEEERDKIQQSLVFSYQGELNTSQDGEKEDNTLSLDLRVPSNFNLAVKSDIANAMHSYMVNCAIAEWLLVTPAKEMAEGYQQSAKAAQIELHNVLSKRIRPTRVHTPEQSTPLQNELRYE